MSESGIFKEAIKLSPDQRAAFLDQACAANPELRGEVESLLRAHDASGSFLQNDPARAPGTIPLAPITERAGSVIGRYKLLQQIGEGGFGSVYMAEQREPVKRRVALKIIKLGMDTREVVARFEAERQALALMDHPNIAKVLDAGATDTGRPFFVMELVKGVPITEFCDLNHLPTADRLGLFVLVCRAVQHAHQKGVIHRDIKPTNVLVTLHDGKPVPKVIDFGVAKALNQELTEKTLFTAHGQMIGTPQYMSPEQAEMSGLDIDIRADVYSLGVLLYELLTGTTPLEAASLRKTAYADMQRLIKEQEAPRPSHRISTLGERLSAVARDRGCEPSRLGALLRGDLDWVVLKALEKERGRRYESADGFAADVQRFLGNEPVEAHPPSLVYKVRKFVRRNRGPVLAAAAMIGLLCLGLAGTINRMIAARTEAERALQAEEEATKARDAALEAAEEKEIARKAAAADRAIAEQERQIAVKAGHKLSRHLYVSTANHIQAAWEANNFIRVQQLLDQQRPGPGEEDLRNFEWHFFDRLMHAEFRTVTLEPAASKIHETMRTKQGSRAAFGKSEWRLVFSADGAIAAGATESISAPSSGGFGPGAKKESDPIPVWELATGRIVLNVPNDPDTEDGLLVVDVSQDGKRLVVSHVTLSGDDTKVRIDVWDVLAKKVLKKIFSDGLVGLALSPDGRRLAVMPQSRNNREADSLLGRRVIKIWDLDEDKTPLEFERPLVAVGPWRQMTFTADGKRLLLRRPKVSDMDIGRVVLAGALPLPLQVITFDAETGKQLAQKEFNGGRSGIDAQFTADGRRMIAPSRNPRSKNQANRNQVGVLDVESGDEIANFEPNFPPSGAIISPDGSRVAIWSSEVIQLWNVATGRQTATMKGHTSPVNAVSFRAERARLLSAHVNGVLKEWDIQEVERIGPIVDRGVPAMPAQRPWPKELQFAKDQKDPKFRFLSLRGDTSKDGTRSVAAEFKAGFLGSGKFGNVGGGTRVLTDVFVYDAAGTELPKFSGHKAPLTSLAISANGRLVISGDLDNEIKVWETDTLRVVLKVRAADRDAPFKLPDGEKTGIRGSWISTTFLPLANMSFSPDRRRLAAALPDGVKAWEVDGFREIFAAPDNFVEVMWSPDGRRLLATARRINEPVRSLKVWEIDSGKQIYASADLAGSRIISFDGQRLALSTLKKMPSWSSEIKVLNLATRTELGTVKLPIPAYMILSPDGNRLATSSPLGEILVWDVATGDVVFRLNGHTMDSNAPIFVLAFSPDGKRLASTRSGAVTRKSESYGKGELILWDMTTGGELMRLSGIPYAGSNPPLSFSSDGHRIEMGLSIPEMLTPRIFDGTPRAVLPK